MVTRMQLLHPKSTQMLVYCPTDSFSCRFCPFLRVHIQAICIFLAGEGGSNNAGGYRVLLLQGQKFKRKSLSFFHGCAAMPK